VASVFAALTLGFSACEKEKTDVAPTATEDPTLKRILALGFDKKNIEDKGTYYLVEGDIRFDKQAAGTTPITQPGVIAQSQDQSHSWELIAYDNQPNLTYTVNSSSLSVAAIQDAVDEWNAVQGCRVKLTYTTNSNANITFVSQDLGFSSDGGKILGQADFPDNGTAGRVVRIDPTTPTTYSALFKFTVVHELGHTFGFRHTNWAGREGESYPSNSPNYVRGANGAVLINGTPTSDPSSVMNATASFWTGFSSNDIIAFQNLYPVFATSLGSGYYKILNRATGKSIDVSGGGSNRNNGVQIVQWGDGGSQSEQWYMQSDGSDHYRIVNRVINKSIDVNGGAIPTSTSNPGTDVPLVGWDTGSSGNAQSWRFQDVGGGYYKIVNRYTNRCMDVSGGGSNGNDGVPLVQYYYQGHASQQWRLAQ